MSSVPDVNGKLPESEYRTINRYVKDVAAIRRLTADGALASRDQILAVLDPPGDRRVKVAGVLTEMVNRGELTMTWNDELRDYVFRAAPRDLGERRADGSLRSAYERWPDGAPT